ATPGHGAEDAPAGRHDVNHARPVRPLAVVAELSAHELRHARRHIPHRALRVTTEPDRPHPDYTLGRGGEADRHLAVVAVVAGGGHHHDAPLPRPPDRLVHQLAVEGATEAEVDD